MKNENIMFKEVALCVNFQLTPVTLIIMYDWLGMIGTCIKMVLDMYSY